MNFYCYHLRRGQLKSQSNHKPDKWNVKMYIHQKEHKSVYFLAHGYAKAACIFNSLFLK